VVLIGVVALLFAVSLRKMAVWAVAGSSGLAAVAAHPLPNEADRLVVSSGYQ